jgi:RND family efflux transporter MFP subunit
MRLKSLAAVLFIALAVGTSSCGSNDSAEIHDSSPSLSVETYEVRLVSEPARMEVTGEARSRNRIEIASKISGRILELPVTEGSRVRRGDLLVKLDAPELTSALLQARAAEEAAHLEWQTATRQAERYRRLAAGEVVTARDLELALVAEAGTKAGYERARATTEMSRRNQEYAELRAPRDTRVVSRRIREGDLANPGQPLLVLEDDSRPEVRVTLPTQLEWSVTAGDPAEIRLVSSSQLSISATVDRVAPAADHHTFEVFLTTDSLSVPSGTYVQVAFLGEPTEVIRVPEEALVRRGPLTGVSVVREGMVTLRWLRMTPDGRVTAGLKPGEHVVLNPPNQIQAGQQVEVIS